MRPHAKKCGCVMARLFLKHIALLITRIFVGETQSDVNLTVVAVRFAVLTAEGAQRSPRNVFFFLIVIVVCSCS